METRGLLAFSKITATQMQRIISKRVVWPKMPPLSFIDFMFSIAFSKFERPIKETQHNNIQHDTYGTSFH